MQNFFRVLLVLWVGGLWTAGIAVAPILFHYQPDSHLAGSLAGRLFAVETYLGVAAAAIALALPGRLKMLWVYVAAALLALNEWGLRPLMTEARLHGLHFGLSFGAWHGVSTVLYGLACLATLTLIWKNDFR